MSGPVAEQKFWPRDSRAPTSPPIQTSPPTPGYGPRFRPPQAAPGAAVFTMSMPSPRNSMAVEASVRDGLGRTRRCDLHHQLIMQPHPAGILLVQPHHVPLDLANAGEMLFD